MSAPVIIVTGASRGLGKAVVSYLLRQSTSKLVLVSRSEEPLAAIKEPNPERVEYIAADISNPETPAKLVKKAIDAYGRLDSVVLNHGVLDPVAKIADANIEAWRKSFDVNFFTAVDLVRGHEREIDMDGWLMKRMVS
jgi:NAD(P)-dependent dehydrogenase (short-subunit alcohol dehydrogenase family)